MKKLVATIMMFGLVIGLNQSIAQKGTKKQLTPEERTEKKVKKLTKELSLTEAQQIKMKSIHESNRLERDKLKSEMKALKVKVKAQREKEKEEIRSILDNDQKVKFDQMLKEREAKKAERKKNHHKK